jgi:hypothetical protein
MAKLNYQKLSGRVKYLKYPKTLRAKLINKSDLRKIIPLYSDLHPEYKKTLPETSFEYKRRHKMPQDEL